MAFVKKLQKSFFEIPDFRHFHSVQKTVHGRKKRNHFFLERHRLVLRLFQKLGEPPPSFYLFFGRFIQILAELDESGEFPVLGKVHLQPAGDFFHRLCLGRRTDAGNRETDIQSRPDTLVKKFRLEINLPVGYGNDVGGNVSRNIGELSLDYRKSGERPAAVLLVHFRRAFQEPRVKIKNIARISFPARRTPEKKRNFPVSPGVPRKVVVDYNRVLPLFHKIFSDCAADVRRQKLQSRAG